MKTLRSTIVFGLAIVLTTSLFSSRAGAQFPGDIFFENPSLVVTQGQTAELEVQFFAGVRVFGAAMFDLVYEPARVQVEEVSAGQAGVTAYAVTLSNRIAAAVFNDESLSHPFGTVGLVRVRVRPLVAAGERVQITITSRNALDTAGATFSSSRGFSAMITVVPAGAVFSTAAASTSIINGELAPGLDPVHGRVAFRRAGHWICIWEPTSRKQPAMYWKAHWWETKDINVPSD